MTINTEQHTLLSDTPIARATDLPTSHAAAAEVTGNGSRASQQQRVLEGLRAYANCTSRELAAHINMDRYSVARRLPELLKPGLVVQGESRRCSVGNRPAVTWRAV